MLRSSYLISSPLYRDVDLHPMGKDVLVKVNGLEVPLSGLPYQHPTGLSSLSCCRGNTDHHNSSMFQVICIKVWGSLFLLPFITLESILIKKKGEGLSLYAPRLGLQEVYFDKDTWKASTIFHGRAVIDALTFLLFYWDFQRIIQHNIHCCIIGVVKINIT